MDSAAPSGSGKDDSAVEPSTSNRQIIQVEKRFCPHCNKTVSFKTFKAHKRLHYDSSNKKWLVSTPTLPIVFESNDKDAPTSLGIRQVEVMDQSIDYMPPSSIFDGEFWTCFFTIVKYNVICIRCIQVLVKTVYH